MCECECLFICKLNYQKNGNQKNPIRTLHTHALYIQLYNLSI